MVSQGDVGDRRRGRESPLDAAALERLALRYVERFATTRARLAAYLHRKVAARGVSDDAPAPEAIAERLAALGYIDDRAFGEARAAGMARRGLGARRVTGALRAAGLDREDLDAIAPAVEARALAAALALARRRRIGPFAPPSDASQDPRSRERALAMLVRSGHPFDLAKKLLSLSAEEAEALLVADS